jgi:flagellar motor switch/type III secretory pathway protein FliN
MANAKDFLLDDTILKKVAKSFEEPISKTISANINKSVSVVHKETLYHMVGSGLKYFGAQYINVQGTFKGKTKGAFYFLMPTGEALNISGTMLGLSPDELLAFMTKGYHEEAEDAFKEVMSQTIGQVGTVLRSTYQDSSGEVVSTKDINILENLKEFETNIEGDEFVFFVFEIAFKGEESFLSYFVLSKELAFSLAPLEGAAGGVNPSESKSLDVVSKEELEGNVEVLRRIQVPIIVTLAQKRMTIEEILKQLSVGSIIEFNVAFDSYLDLQIGDKKIGEGEVVTVNDVYGLQIKSILSARETLETLL